MALLAGARLGPYEILTPLGAGGMGEVYRARDTKLGRDVALKVLPDSLAHNPERLARFEREAHLLAALNHPAIAHIYGFEDSTDVPALVMELVDGASLADRCRSTTRCRSPDRLPRRSKQRTSRASCIVICGKELFYLAPDGALMRVAVAGGPGWTASAPTKVLEGRYVTSTAGNFPRNYDIAADRQRFLMLKPAGSEAAAPSQIVVVQHFDEELKRLLPAK
jgi:hypothetical protein